jgi:hypothetical protein
MTQGQLRVAWAELRTWVAWLHDCYELGTEDRLPRCWGRHPGLVEELWALRAWRTEIYSGGQPSGQAARYWHAELRQLVHAAVPMYAAGCRTGHRGAATLAAETPELAEEWASADPLARTPEIDIAAGRARLAGECLTTATVAAALDSKAASDVPFLRDYIFYAGAWWVPASSGWVQVPGLARSASPSRPARTLPPRHHQLQIVLFGMSHLLRPVRRRPARFAAVLLRQCRIAAGSSPRAGRRRGRAGPGRAGSQTQRG